MPMPSWLAPLLTRKMLICVFTGFSSGLPLFLLLNLPASDAGQRAHRRKIARVPAIALALLVAVLGLGPLTLTV